MEIQTRTVEVVKTEEVRGIFLTEQDVRRLSFPLFKLRALVNEDQKSDYPALNGTEAQTVFDFKELVDDFQS